VSFTLSSSLVSLSSRFEAISHKSLVLKCPEVEHLLVWRRTGNSVSRTEGRDKWWHEATPKVSNHSPPEVMFILNVSIGRLSSVRKLLLTVPSTFLGLWIY
jgi:hypothetical protein